MYIHRWGLCRDIAAFSWDVERVRCWRPPLRLPLREDETVRAILRRICEGDGSGPIRHAATVLGSETDRWALSTRGWNFDMREVVEQRECTLVLKRPCRWFGLPGQSWCAGFVSKDGNGRTESWTCRDTLCQSCDNHIGVCPTCSCWCGLPKCSLQHESLHVPAAGDAVHDPLHHFHCESSS